MSAQVIFFPIKFVQSDEKLRQLASIQEHFTYARNGLENRIRTLGPYERMVERQRHYATIRAHVRLENFSHQGEDSLEA